ERASLPHGVARRNCRLVHGGRSSTATRSPSGQTPDWTNIGNRRPISRKGREERSKVSSVRRETMVATQCEQRHDLIIGVTPFGLPNAQLAAALSRAGALGVLDLGRDSARARTALAQMSRWAKEPWGVRVPAGCPLGPHEIPAGATTILLPSQSAWSPTQLGGRRVLVEVNDLGEAQGAIERGADGLIARGSEGGGGVSELTTYVLLQLLLADAAITVPVWASGGLGRHSASAAIAGGAAGVVL